MIVYLDSSGLVKRYVEEPDSREFIALWQPGRTFAASAVGFAEVVAAIGRRRREGGLAEDAYRVAVGALRTDWRTMEVWAVTARINEIVERPIYHHPLRGFDAIHLATALRIREDSVEEVLFASADRRLRLAAKEEGLDVFPEQGP